MAGRRLAGGPAEMVNQIRTFIKQAEEARDTDLLRANNLAERAEVLAQELAKRVR
jgi:ribose 1,5-bisphosphokinase PhnN